MTWDSDKSTAVDPDDPDADEQLTADEWDAHVEEGHLTRVDVTSTAVTLGPGESAWVDTAAAGGNVTVMLPADADVADGTRQEVNIEDGTNDTDVVANTGQSIVGANPTLKNAGETLQFEYKAATSTWIERS